MTGLFRTAAIGLFGLTIALPALSRTWLAADEERGELVQRRFERVDADSDGQVTPAELNDAELFSRLDTDRDGVITLPEAKQAVAAGALEPDRQPQPEPEEIRQGPKPLKPGDLGIGRRIPDLLFEDINGNQRRLSDYADHPAVVVAMTGTGCPLCQKYAPTLAALEEQFAEQTVPFVFVNPNQSESKEKIAAAISAHGFKGAYVHDVEESLTRHLDAETSTEVFVLDAARTLVYRGAVDDQYGFAYALEEPRQTYLIDALNAVLAGRLPKVAATSAPGCEIFYSSEAPPTQSEITYHNRISRIVQRNCQECHRDEGLAPFALDSYASMQDYAGMIRRVVEQGLMPPWFAAPHDDEESSALRWANDCSLSATDKQDLLTWIEAGLPEGDPADAPLPVEFPDEWHIGQPDVVFQIPQPIEISATGQMPYEYVQIETNITEDRWVQAVEVKPTAAAVVHHVLVFVRKPLSKARIGERDGFFAAYVPGNTYQRYPTGLAKKLPANSKLIFQLHYTPNGTAMQDQTRLGIVFADEPPRHAVRNAGIANHKIAIPPGAAKHAEEASLTVPQDVRALAFMPHMHLRGDAFRYDLVRPDGTRQRVLDVPRYDFNWQLEYRLAEPLEIPRGSRIEVTGWYDNSDGNPANPDPTATVKWGPQTDDEMLIGYVEYYVPSEPIDAETDATDQPAVSDEGSGRSRLEAAFRRADRNGDGQVTREEFPRPRLFDRLDRDGDGVITEDEI